MHVVLSCRGGTGGAAQQGIRHRGVDVSVGRPGLREAGIGTGCFVCCRAVVGCVRAVLAGAEVTEATAVQVGEFINRAPKHRTRLSRSPGAMVRVAGYAGSGRAIAGSTHRTHGHRDRP